MNELTTIAPNHVEAYRASTDAAELCKGIVLASSSNIQGKKYVSVEGWMAIARAHGCAAGATDVQRVDGGFRATGEVRDMYTGTLIAQAEGFVGEDEPVWFGGTVTDKWGKTKAHTKRADYAIRAMAQTRAISRACRSAFAHVVVMMNAGLATTPAEEVPFEGFNDPHTGEIIEAQPVQTSGPQPRTKLEGLHSSKTALKQAIHRITSLVHAAGSEREIAAIQKEHIETIRQANKDWPELLTGDPAIPEDVGLKGAIEIRREQLKADDGMFKVLIDSMKQCETLKSLTNWMGTNEALIDGLEDAERRSFELAYNLHESAILAMDKVSAGA